MLKCAKIIQKYREIMRFVLSCLCNERRKFMADFETNPVVLIDASDKDAIDEKINELKNCYPQLKKMKFDLIAFLTEQFQFVICEVPLEDDTTGFILVDDENLLNFKNFITYRLIATNESLIRFTNYLQKRRFIVAHEFGHYILHKHKNQVQFAKRDTEHFNSKEEQEAEYFARSFLMPKSDVIQIIMREENQKLSIAEKVNIIRETFNVTENKARYRLQELGLI